MRRAPVILGLSAALVGCGMAGASQPDGHNPAHCIAALNYQIMQWDQVGGHPEQVKEGFARVMFELHRSEKNGHSSAETKAEALSFQKGYLKDLRPLNKLAATCVAAEDADPEFAKRRADALAFMNGQVPRSR